MPIISASSQDLTCPPRMSFATIDSMMNSKNKIRLRTLCLFLFTFTTLSGCSTSTKQNRIISLQKNRIQSLKKQVRRQNRLIDKYKTKKWLGTSKKSRRTSALKKLDKLMKQGMWVSALKNSSALSAKYPKWVGLKQRRAKIFAKMGLKKQARRETLRIQKLRAQRVKKTQKRL